ncbi:hypothetical protein ACFVTE_11840 [Arthrobacter sp. NPDC058097]|uniref:hypothetical protein n=1 Tax=Arthrobacter sp. NPDC058097 TaxID=3346340 RepID=UPI0036D7C4FE
MTSVSDFLLLGDIIRRERGSIRTGPFGTTLKASEYAAVGVPVVSVGEVGYGTFRVHKETRRVGPEVLKRLPVYRLNVDDIVFARKGAVDRSAVVRDGQDGWFLGSDGIRVRLGRGSRQVNPIYLGYALHAADVRRWLLRNATGTTMATLNQDLLERVPVWLPERREQDRIASALDEASDLIDSLERLSAKTRDVKQGMMQELLTGRTRLPGFTEEWGAVRLRDVGSTYGGLVGKDKSDFGSGSGLFVSFTEVMTGPRLRGSRLERVRVSKGERQNRVERGDIIFNGSSEIPEEVALAAAVDFDPSGDVFLNSFCFGFRLSDRQRIDPVYLAHYFRSSRGRAAVSVLAQGATRYNIAKTKLIELEPELPPIDEQQAVVAVLRDAEAEIEAVERRLESARAVKVGMMQELLTGRTRLPVKEEA